MKYLICLLLISSIAFARGGGGFGGGRSGGFGGGRSGGFSSPSKPSTSTKPSTTAPSKTSPTKPFSPSKRGSFGNGTYTPPPAAHYYVSRPSFVVAPIYYNQHHSSWGFFEYYMFYEVFIAPRHTTVVYSGNSVSNACRTDAQCLNGETCNVKVNKCEIKGW
jgi:hypothetical protein